VLASRFRHELSALVADLPDTDTGRGLAGTDDSTRRPTGSGSRALAIHAAVVVVVSAILVARWATGAVPPGPDGPWPGSGGEAAAATSGLAYFWPMFPMFWLLLSLGVHFLPRARRG
jgi:hypothetical protein